MKVLVSYMYPIDNTETNYGHTEVTVDYWDTLVVLDLISGASPHSVDTSNVIITSVFHIPAPRFTQVEKDNLKDWMQLAYEYIESDDEIQGGIIKSMIKELNE